MYQVQAQFYINNFFISITIHRGTDKGWYYSDITKKISHLLLTALQSHIFNLLKEVVNISWRWFLNEWVDTMEFKKMFEPSVSAYNMVVVF